MNIEIFMYIGGIGFIGAGLAWLWAAWVWYTTFPVPYLWLIWALTSPMWFLGSLIFLGGPLSKRAMIRRLRTRGVPIITKFFNVETNFRLKVNSQYPYYIQSVGTNPKTGERLFFKSGNIWFDPTSLIDKGREIPVIIDPDRPGDYLMDISFLDLLVKEAAQTK